MEDPTPMIGHNLKKLRNKNNLSLDAIAELTGISKATLSQIERGKSSPTLSTLWKIATGLKVPFSVFMEKTDIEYEIISCEKLDPIIECNGQMKIYPFFPFDATKNFELLYINLEPNCSHRSPKHDEGIIEYILVVDGNLHVTLADVTLSLQKGQALKFVANIDHSYSNQSDLTCSFQNLIVYQK